MPNDARGTDRDTLGVVWPGFVLLSLTALALRAANRRVFHPADVEWRMALPLTATMNAFLGGDADVIWPAAAASLACFLLNAGLLWHLGRIERAR